MTNIYFAPMEGITTPTYRKVHRKYFGGIDKYFSPFIVVTSAHHLKKRETREYIPFEENMVPQILTAGGCDMAWAAKMLKNLGYGEVNLNLGCPAATVVTKGKGSGLLRDKYKLEKFFEELFSESDLPEISIKTRCGFVYHEEAEELAKIYAKYPFKEIIVHPRIREEYYQGSPNLESFEIIKKKANSPVVYNGDIYSVSGYEEIIKKFPDISGVMIGRGLLINPALAEEIKEKEDYANTNRENTGSRMDNNRHNAGRGIYNQRISDFMSELYDEYMVIMSGERDVLFKLKELWTYLSKNYPDAAQEYKAVMKSKNGAEYKAAVRRIIG
ncbi:MAG: tRNA-dihydrouridine synthase family protein [Lachnospiraceae bacterium]|nr:tRNA-dihydrouridine synthase family protein [Lachnospiraceae bacterium]